MPLCRRARTVETLRLAKTGRGRTERDRSCRSESVEKKEELGQREERMRSDRASETSLDWSL